MRLLFRVIISWGILVCTTAFPTTSRSPRYISEFRSSDESHESREIEIAPYVPFEFLEPKIIAKPENSRIYPSYVDFDSRPISSSYISRPRHRLSTPSPVPQLPVIFQDPSPSLSSDAVVFDDEPPLKIWEIWSSTTTTTEKPHKWEKKALITTEPSKYKKNGNDMYTERFLAKAVGSTNCPKDSMYSRLQKRCIPKRNIRGNPAIG